MTFSTSEIELRQENVRLTALMEALRLENERLQAEVTDLRARLEKLERGGNGNGGSGSGHAAPFARRKRKAEPKKPGRKPGDGLPRSYKKAPTPTEPEVDVPAPCCCPDCGGDVEITGEEIVTRTEFPKVQPRVVPYRVRSGRCRDCGCEVRGKHEQVDPDQRGATAHRLGKSVHAFALIARHDLGMPVRKIAELLGFFGIQVTHSALLQFVATQNKSGKPLHEALEQLRRELLNASAVHTDDTSWRVSHGEDQRAWLMGFESAGDPARDPQVALFQIRQRHRSVEVREVIPLGWLGTRITDRFTSYDALTDINQQKCHAHLIRTIQEALAKQHPGARSFGYDLLRVLNEARELHKAFHNDEIDRHEYDKRAGPLPARLSYLLRDRELRDPDNQRLLNEIGKHDDRSSLLRFVDDPHIEPTNNRAERLLRKPVIARKTAQCSRTLTGAAAYAAGASLVATLKRRLEAPFQALISLLSGNPLPAPQPR